MLIREITFGAVQDVDPTWLDASTIMFARTPLT
jgi:hypothetical protein